MRTTETINVTVPISLLEEARSIKINLSQAAAKGIEAAVKREQKIRELGI